MMLAPDWARRDALPPLFRTNAVFAALREAGGIGRLFEALRLLPVGFRDSIYRAIARCRYAVFGRWKPQPLPRKEWAERFLP
jgi:predicted DCC family thiol-disulfide oxidoreductase YuxK